MNRQEQTLNLFDELNISYNLVEHPPLFTCADSDKYNLKFDGVMFKNLFLRNKNKSQYYLVSLPEYKRADLKFIRKCLGETILSFGSEEALLEKLCITPGSVSLLNVIMAGNTDVEFIIDKDALTCEKVAFHPNVNTATISFSPKDIEIVMNKFGAKYRFADIG